MDAFQLTRDRNSPALRSDACSMIKAPGQYGKLLSERGQTHSSAARNQDNTNGLFPDGSHIGLHGFSPIDFHMARPRLNAIVHPTCVPVCAVRLLVKSTPLAYPGTDAVCADNPARANRSVPNEDLVVANPNDRRVPKKAYAHALRVLQKHLVKHHSADT